MDKFLNIVFVDINYKTQQVFTVKISTLKLLNIKYVLQNIHLFLCNKNLKSIKTFRKLNYFITLGELLHFF